MGLSWSDLNPTTWAGQVKSRLKKDFGGAADSKSAQEKAAILQQQGTAAGGFADQGQAGYGAMSTESAAARDYLRRLASGEQSVSAEQLRQANEQNLSTQRSFAASASPQNAPMAARNAMMNMNRANVGLAGQQAVAGLQERQGAQKALMDSILQQRQQDAQVALGSRGNAVSSFGGATPDKSWLEKYGPSIASGAAAIAAFSDKRLKEDIEDGEGEASKALKSLRAYSYKYKDEKYGKGRRVGIMAQDLEKAGLGHTVIETKEGKAIHGGHLSTANTALISSLEKRVAKIEGTRK